MFRDLVDLLKANCLPQDSEGLRDFRTSSDGKTSAFSPAVVGFWYTGFLQPSVVQNRPLCCVGVYVWHQEDGGVSTQLLGYVVSAVQGFCSSCLYPE